MANRPDNNIASNSTQPASITNVDASTALTKEVILERTRLRRQGRLARQTIGRDAQRRAADGIAKRVANCGEFMRARRVAIYMANDGEIDLLPLAARAWSRGKQILVPIVDLRDTMRWAELEPGTRLCAGKWDIMQPKSTATLWPLATIDLLIVPLVAFDHQGNRLGRGAGYYDRSIAALRRCRPKLGKPFLLGAAHSAQQVGQIPAASWDIPLDAVVTEARLLRF